ncbi:hypothetical protein [Streptomyces sp. NBC_00009]|uniref:hypothetical protein n=1 Tax=Streptomyces sp. NBC_00009 TaxID=2975620 RepID=UPI003250AA44
MSRTKTALYGPPDGNSVAVAERWPLAPKAGRLVDGRLQSLARLVGTCVSEQSRKALLPGRERPGFPCWIKLNQTMALACRNRFGPLLRVRLLLS